MKLYELTDSYLQIQEMIEEGAEGLEDTLQALEDAIEQKAENIGKVIRNIEGDVEAIKTEEKRLSDRRRALENRVKNLKTYLEEQMNLAGQKKIKTATMSFNIQKNPPTVKIEDERYVPEQFWRVKRDVDRKSLIAYLKEGNEVKGIQLVQNESLRIR